MSDDDSEERTIGGGGGGFGMSGAKRRRSESPSAEAREGAAAASSCHAAAAAASSSSSAAAAAAAPAVTSMESIQLDLRGRRLEESLHAAVVSISSAERLSKPVDPRFLYSLHQMLQQLIENMAIDLRAFARHARRSLVNVDDVLLCARRNEGLEELLLAFMAQRGIARPSAKRKKTDANKEDI